MKLISFNVNGIRASQKKGTLSEAFLLKPDILAIQETKCIEDQLPENKFAPEGYAVYFDSATERKGYSGVAVYTKEKPLHVTKGLGIKAMDHEGRLLTLHFKDFIFITGYFPNGGRDEEHFKFKLKFYNEFLAYIKRLEKENKNIIFCGDLNVAHCEIDLARPKENSNQIGFLPIERAWVDSVIKNGFIDTFRLLHGSEVKYSWWDQKTRSRDRNIGWRIDYFFVSQALKGSVKKADILNDVFGSDHCPILLEI